ncbi:MAG: hypothetical protein WCJ62_08030 [Flavobacterium sp.]
MQLIKNFEQNKIFVYDTSRGFYNFLKLNFKNDYSIDLCNRKEQFDNFYRNVSCYQHCLFVINSHEDILNLMKLFSKTDTILLAVMIKDLEDKFDDFNNIIKLNMNLPKKDLSNFLNKYLSLSVAE